MNGLFPEGGSQVAVGLGDDFRGDLDEVVRVTGWPLADV